jgi:hypothetical protein
LLVGTTSADSMARAACRKTSADDTAVLSSGLSDPAAMLAVTMSREFRAAFLPSCGINT